MPGKKLNQYQGRLTPGQIADGINAAIRNAKRLADDAALVLSEGRLPSAATLAILSIEESGKVSILRGLAVAKSDKEVALCWRDYRSHTKKNVTWMFPQLVAGGARKLDDFSALFGPDSDHPYVLDHVKQIGFYSDCLGPAHWSEPTRVIGEDLAKMLVQTAHIFAKAREVSEKEIELWIKHLDPVWNVNPGWMRKALENWYTDMQECGLAPEGENIMEEFIRRGIGRTSVEPQQK